MGVRIMLIKIKIEMARQMLTQSEVARMAGISRQRVSLLMLGQSKSLTTARLIWHALGLHKQEPDAKSQDGR